MPTFIYILYKYHKNQDYLVLTNLRIQDREFLGDYKISSLKGQMVLRFVWGTGSVELSSSVVAAEERGDTRSGLGLGMTAGGQHA